MALNSAELLVKFNVNQSGSNDLGNPIFSGELRKLLQFVVGTGANQADLVFTDTRTIAISTNDDIDLADVLASAFGSTITIAEMVGIVISNKSTTQTLTVGVAGTFPWVTMWAATGDGIKVFPGGVFCNFAPDASGLGAVVGGASDVLRIANGAGATCEYDIAILARTA